MSKQNDILNRMKSNNRVKTGAAIFLETMNEQVQENKQEPLNEKETKQINETINKTEQFTEQTSKTINKSILEKYSEMKTKEEMFTRQTYLIRNELINRFDNAAKNRRKGFKTEVINKILENFLEENEL